MINTGNCQILVSALCVPQQLGLTRNNKPVKVSAQSVIRVQQKKIVGENLIFSLISTTGFDLEISQS